jgi:hypothetical protein
MAVMNIISPKDAKAAGLKFYFNGKPCPQGHIAERLVACRSCIECHKAVMGAWREPAVQKHRGRRTGILGWITRIAHK